MSAALCAVLGIAARLGHRFIPLARLVLLDLNGEAARAQIAYRAGGRKRGPRGCTPRSGLSPGSIGAHPGLHLGGCSRFLGHHRHVLVLAFQACHLGPRISPHCKRPPPRLHADGCQVAHTSLKRLREAVGAGVTCSTGLGSLDCMKFLGVCTRRFLGFEFTVPRRARREFNLSAQIEGVLRFERFPRLARGGGAKRFGRREPLGSRWGMRKLIA